jgi:hypothetical protein
VKKLIAAVAITAALAAAQVTNAPAEQRGKKIVADALAALGGDKFLNMQDRVESGRAYSFYREEISGLSIAKIYTRYLSVPPSKTGTDLGLRERQAFGKSEESSVLFLEDRAYEISFRGSKELPRERYDKYRDSTLRNVFYIFRQRLKEPGMIFESRGADVLENQPVEIVDITDSQNRLVTVYFHQSTKLPVRQVYSRRDPTSHERDEEVTVFTRYRDADGIQWPHQITRERNGEKVFQIFAESVKINTGLTDNAFSVAPPAQSTSRQKKK